MSTISFRTSFIKSGFKSFVFDATLVVSFAAITAIAAQIRIPLPGTPVPITLQSLAVILSGAMLGAKRGALSQLLLIIAGACGFSVFAQSTPGYIALLGPTGGYILGFVFASYVAGKMSEQKLRTGWWTKNLYLFLASLFIFLPGVVWLSCFTGKNIWLAIQIGFIPFIAGDIVKTLAAASILSLWSKR